MEMMKKYLIGILLLGMVPLVSCQDGILNKDRKKLSTREVAVELPQNGGRFTVKKGDVIKYSRRVCGSVGTTYSVNYDKSAFKMEYLESEKDQPDVPGGDECVGTTYFEALKKGKFKIKVVHDFRGKTEKVVRYNITVK